ncbi:MAG: CoB--CoM heterodisulfide reductase iron-sulfur subunit B family protein [Candidatus Helarchaeota archaeon]|nr:CoB--CoM heterodisulfide reductase iron-sulfur subunit B family protein [Candidatus Helarchaeota archaeon]
MAEMKLFLGCTIPNRLPHLESASRIAFNKLGIQVSDAPFACCPEPIGFQSVNHEAWLAMGARNLCLAEAEGKDIVSLCNGCYQSLAVANHDLQKNATEKAHINHILAKVNKSYKGTVKVKHFVHVLHENIPKIKSSVKKPMTNLKVAIHAGCHYARPTEVLKSDDPWKPSKQRDIIAATGAKIIDYPEEKLCCGNGASYLSAETADAITKKKIANAKKAGANCFVVNCPACFQRLDTMREMPVIYLTQLVALAMGESFDSLNMKFHVSKACDGFELKSL